MRTLATFVLGVLLAGCGGSSGGGSLPPASRALEGKWTLTTTSTTSQGEVGIFFMNLSSQGNGDYFAPASQALGCYGDGTVTGSQCYGPVDKFM